MSEQTSQRRADCSKVYFPLYIRNFGTILQTALKKHFIAWCLTLTQERTKSIYS